MIENPTIFLVEDEEHLLALYKRALQSIGTVETAQTADEAIAKLQNTSQLPDVILLDLLIPEHRKVAVDFKNRMGFRVFEYVQESSVLSQVPVLVMTNLDSAEDRRRAVAMHAKGYIVKSNVVPRQIIASIKEVLS